MFKLFLSSWLDEGGALVYVQKGKYFLAVSVKI